MSVSRSGLATAFKCPACWHTSWLRLAQPDAPPALARVAMSLHCRTLSGHGRVISDGVISRDVAGAMRRPLPFIITNSKLPSSIPRVSEKQRKLARRPTLIRSSGGPAMANFKFCSPSVMCVAVTRGLGVRLVGVVTVQLLIALNSP